jgi:hypothetical protein
MNTMQNYLKVKQLRFRIGSITCVFGSGEIEMERDCILF